MTDGSKPHPEPDLAAGPQAARRHRGWWIALLVVVLAAGGYYFVAKRSAKAPAGEAGSAPTGRSARFSGVGGVLPVGVATAKTTDIDVYLNGLGAVTPIATTVVRARVNGTLVKLHFTEGQMVKAGQLLAELDPRPYQVAVIQAQGQLDRDSALLNGARVDLKRYQLLVEQNSIQRQLLDNQNALVKQYEGTVLADQGNLDNAKLQLQYSKITAPITGRIGLRQVDLGNLVQTGDTNGIATITQLEPITAVFSLPEDDIPAVMKKLRADATLTTEAWSRDQKTKLATGKLLTMDNQVDPSTGTVRLKAQFDNADHMLFPQQFVNVHMLLNVVRGATAIPQAAIQRSSNGQFVYVVKDDHTVTVRNVSTGATQGDLTAITSGLAPGEVVVVDGIDKLREGAKVAPVARGGPTDPALQPVVPAAARSGHRHAGAPGPAASAPASAAHGTR
ncbi:MAG: Multidrug efflux system MdtABC-TolC, membrane fusion component MdtA [Burkholderiaceae bacterium]|jgi:multidrug efflux system membrane fusion protein|nr:MAG: Multidrug efflux system MdtABC-TolC, membrane fusion component MdtA [Burkholderiaceae bacterium]